MISPFTICWRISAVICRSEGNKGFPLFSYRMRLPILIMISIQLADFCQDENDWIRIPSVKGGEAQKVFATWLFDLGPAE